MTMPHRLLALAAASVLTASFGNAQVAPAAAKQWSVAYEGQLRYGVEYWLFNGTSRIGYRKRPRGLADLDWTSSGGNFQFYPQAPAGTRDHRVGPVLDGEKVAIYNTKKQGFLKYYNRGGRDDLTELTFAPPFQPIYDWEFRDVSVAGGSVHFALWNVSKQRYLVRRATTDGIGLGWYSESSGQGAIHDATVTMTAQPVTQGFLPFLGYYGGGVNFNSVLTEVRNATNNAYLSFVKPGHSTQECGNSSAVILLAPGAALTAAQMTALYGSATPSLQNRIAFLACAGGATNASSVFLNIKYRDI
jgi:hypothetical protein